MRINTIHHTKYNFNNRKVNNTICNPLQKDVVSFSAMKKSQFSGIDLYVVNRFKAPIEKFNSDEDFQAWCLNKVEEDFSYENFKTSDKSINKKRKEMISEWKNYIQNENDDYNNAILLLAMQGATKSVKPKNNQLPLSLNKAVLAKTIFEIKQEIEKNPKVLFDFNKLYSTNLAKHFIEEDAPVSDITGWIVIPSLKNDTQNFKDNVQKLRALSNKNWCTKTNNALPYLTDGDFHIYLEQGYPKIGIRFQKSKVREIQGELNNGRIPFKYADICLKQIGNAKLDYDAQLQVEDLNRRKEKLAQIKIDLAEPIKNNDVEQILNYFDIKVEKYSPIVKQEKEEKEMFTIESYSAIHDGILFSDIGIDENKLFEKIKSIEGKADFTGSEVTDLGALTFIHGDADFEASKIKDLKNVFSISGNANFKNSNVRILGDLSFIEGNADFENSLVQSLNKLQKIGGNARFVNSKISDLGELKRIGGSANFMNCCIANYGKLEDIEGLIVDVEGNYQKSDVEPIFKSVELVSKFFKGILNKIKL